MLPNFQWRNRKKSQADKNQFAAFDRGYSKIRDKQTLFKLKDLPEKHTNVQVTSTVLGVTFQTVGKLMKRSKPNFSSR